MMDLNGHQTIDAVPLELYRLMTEPTILVRTMPGLTQMEPIGDNHYRADMNMGVAAIKGRYTGQVEFRDAVPGQSFRMMIEGHGPGGFVTMNLHVILTADPPGTFVQYAGDVQIGGMLAALGQRLLSGIATIIIKQFFGNLAKEIQELPR